MNIQVIRLNTSDNIDSSFFHREQQTLESIPNISYIRSVRDLDETASYILITDNQCDLENLPNRILENSLLIIHPEPSLNKMNIPNLKKMNIPIIKGNHISTNAICEYILSTIFHSLTEIPNHQNWKDDMRWERKLLRDQKILILGLNDISQLLRKSLAPLCVDLFIYTPDSYSNEDSSLLSHLNDSKISDIDIIIQTCEATENSPLIDKSLLNKMSPDGILINTSAGKLVNEKDLANHMKLNPMFKSYLDVFATEPFKAGHLSELKNLNKTSNISHQYQRLYDDIIAFEYLIVIEFLKNHSKSSVKSFLNEYKECLL